MTAHRTTCYKVVKCITVTGKSLNIPRWPFWRFHLILKVAHTLLLLNLQHWYRKCFVFLLFWNTQSHVISTIFNFIKNCYQNTPTVLLHQITIRLFLSKLNKIDLINQTVHRLPNRKWEIFAMFLPIETKLVRYHWHI